ncbi:MAG: glycosyltransferase family A protein, partial [Chloroflexota bacterium]
MIIPVYNGERVLPDLLEALAAQTYPHQQTEILVIDNNSVDHTRVVIEQWVNRGVTYLRCEKQGSYAARNVGIARAKGEVLAFTDADCRPAPDWIQAGVDIFRSTKVDRIAGIVTLRLSRRPRLWELVAG